jgi:thioredoxin-related protein
MRQVLKLLVVFGMLFAAPSWAEIRSVETYFFQNKLGDFQAELHTVKQEGKKGIFLFFEMEDCPWCARMKATILNQSAVQDFYRQHFLVYSMDVKGDVPMTDFAGKATTEKAFALENRVRATPTMLFIDGEGKILTRFTGPTRDATEMMMLGHYVTDDAYLHMPFAKFKQLQQATPAAPPPHAE